MFRHQHPLVANIYVAQIWYYKTTTKEIEDANDNFPIFERDSYSFSIIENSLKNTYIGEVNANDADSDSFGTVSYSISSIEKFYIDDQGKLYTINTIDRETRTSYQLRVTAIDGGKKHVGAREQPLIKKLRWFDGIHRPVYYYSWPKRQSTRVFARILYSLYWRTRINHRPQNHHQSNRQWRRSQFKTPIQLSNVFKLMQVVYDLGPNVPAK